MIKIILRNAIAVIFIISGFVKAVDSVGFSFKLEEYFSPTVFNMPFLEPFALPIAALVSSLEIVLGLMLLLKIQLRKTLIALISLCVFFAFLTFYSAYFNVVTDCGCFGDALKFTPWQSFWKDIVLLVGLILIWLFYQSKNKIESNNNLFRKTTLLIGILATIFIVYWGISNEPLIDFRDYKIGTNLKAEKEKLAKNPSEYKTFYVLKNQQTGEEKKINSDDYVLDKTYWQEGTPWEILEDKTSSEIVKQGYQSEVAKFRIEGSNGEDLTEKILNMPNVTLIFSYKPKDLSPEILKKIEHFALNNTPIYGISTDISTFKTIENGSMDGTAIKTIARSNPFVLILKNGVIIDKKPLK
ncbi:MAG: DoxX family protein [Bergeyella zoohelcum]|nr:DoxX family protein [Bergeyella zoohelcum]